MDGIYAGNIYRISTQRRLLKGSLRLLQTSHRLGKRIEFGLKLPVRLVLPDNGDQQAGGRQTGSHRLQPPAGPRPGRREAMLVQIRLHPYPILFAIGRLQVLQLLADTIIKLIVHTVECQSKKNEDSVAL